jgi:hypothetical protein
LKAGGARFVGLDYWGGHLVPVRNGLVSAELPPSGCSIVAVVQMREHPQLLGSSRHITQCFVDLGEDRWGGNTLSGTCRVVGGDPTELRILAASTRGVWKALTAELAGSDRNAGATVAMKEEPGLLRITLAAPMNREVRWSARFDPRPAPAAAPAPVGSLQVSQATPDAPVALTWASTTPFCEVKRDGVVMASAAGRGFIDDSAPAGQVCVYTVTPVNLGEERGEARTVTITNKAYVLGPVPPLPEISLMALKPIETRMGWGQFHTGKSIAGRPLTLGQRVYEHGIGTHAAGEVVYERKPEWKRFVAVLGIDEAERWQNQTSLAGRIVAENAAGERTLLAGSPVLRFGKREVWHFDLALPADCARLRLVIEDGGDGNKSDHADWVNAGFLRE